MQPSPGEKLGHYEILALIGKGGMGEVYRARDTKLDRDVAIKILPPALAQHPDRLARFDREAKTLAALNHPNIAAIFGLEDGSDGTRAIVMELVEGPTLADRIKAGPLELEEALKIAVVIADALEAAHEKGIVHRDLKPANVKAPEDGVVKVLDFGLATAMQSTDRDSADAANSPTLTMGATEAGLILGTAAYMSPEQAAGRRVDKRADIWSFGVVLWEMLAAQRLFKSGETVSHTLADVLRQEIDFAQLAAPRPIVDLLKRCLDRDVKTRLRDIGEARVAIAKYLADPSSGEEQQKSAVRGGSSRLAWAAAGALLLAAGSVSFVHFRESPPQASAIRFQIPAPNSTNLNNVPVLSPDGRSLAVTVTGSDGRRSIWLRNMGALEYRLLPSSEGVAPNNPPFWSPDSRWLGFWADGRIKKIEVTGGPAQTVCSAINFQGGSWSQQGIILFSSGTGEQLFRVPQSGGTPTPLRGFTPDAPVTLVGPEFLPDGRHFLYFARTVPAENSGIYIADLDGGGKTLLIPGDSRAHYVLPLAAGEPGHVLFTREGVLMAQPMDADRFSLRGDAFTVAASVAAFGASNTGALVYRTGSSIGGVTSELIWFDRAGKSLGTVGPPAAYNDVAISPDGKRVAATRGEGSNLDVWTIDVARNVPERFTSDPGRDWDPLWSPDGSRLTFASNRSGGVADQIYWKNATGTGAEELLLKSQSVTQRPKSWSSDGKLLLFMRNLNDLMVLPVNKDGSGGEAKPEPFLTSNFVETQGQFSPGAAPYWVAYTSNESGTNQVHVQSFPPGAGKAQISTNGGAQPRWRPDGKELFYISPDRKLMAVDVKLGPSFQAGVPHELFQTRVTIGGGFIYVFRYDVAPDGKRFLIQSEAGSGTSAEPLTVVLNWRAGVKE